MKPQQWASPCGSQCTSKYSALTQIPLLDLLFRQRAEYCHIVIRFLEYVVPWRVFCKKACDADGETWEECVENCNEMCYKDPVLKDRQWSAYIDRSPGAATYSEECFHACVSGCGYKFDIHPEKASQVRPNRPLKLPPPPVRKATGPSPKPIPPSEDIPCSSA